MFSGKYHHDARHSRNFPMVTCSYLYTSCSKTVTITIMESYYTFAMVKFYNCNPCSLCKSMNKLPSKHYRDSKFTSTTNDWLGWPAIRVHRSRCRITISLHSQPSKYAPHSLCFGLSTPRTVIGFS